LPSAKRQRRELSEDEQQQQAFAQKRLARAKLVLDFWRRTSFQFPNIARVARLVLALPASSAASERSFSTAG